MRNMLFAMTICGAASFMTGCSGDSASVIDDVDSTTTVGEPDTTVSDHSFDDGSGFPKWRPQCPGPRCDPERNPGDDRINPSPLHFTSDSKHRPGVTKPKPGEKP